MTHLPIHIEHVDRPAVQPVSWRSRVQMMVVLFKLRVVFLLVFAALGGAFLAAPGWPGWGQLLLVIVTGTMAAAGSSAINQYVERHTDGKMKRTRMRPLVTGAISRPERVLWVAALLIAVPIAAVFPFRPALSAFLLAGAVIYVGIYTLWLKPLTILNIVVGGGAGSAAVLCGAAAVGEWQNPGAWVLALMLFLWTPCHFWALAILYRDDYQRADVPMLPAKTTPYQASWWVLVHTLPTVMAALLLVLLPVLGWIYFVPVAIVSVDILRRNLALIRTPEPAQAKSFFMASNIYLLVVLVAIYADTFLYGWWH